MGIDVVASETKLPQGRVKTQRERERETESVQGLLINYSSYLENILPSSSQMKPEISVLSFNQGSHSTPGCLFAAAKRSSDAVSNFISWKFGHCKSSGPI